MLIRVLQEKTVRWLQSKVNEDFFLCCWLTTLSIYNPLMGLIYGEVSNNAKKKTYFESSLEALSSKALQTFQSVFPVWKRESENVNKESQRAQEASNSSFLKRRSASASTKRSAS